MEEQCFSVFQFFKKKESVGRCGYCRSQDTFYKNDMWAHRLTVLDYQHLIDRGWRRSGRYLYKSINKKTCCPHYTIRCVVDKFHLSKSQKKVLKTMNEFLIKGKPAQDLYKKKKDEWKLFLENYEGETPAPYSLKDLHPMGYEASTSFAEYGKEQNISKESEAKGAESSSAVTVVGKGIKKQAKESSTIAENIPGVTEGDNPSPACVSFQSGHMEGAPRKKAKMIRRENKLQKLISQGLSEEEAQDRLNSSRVLPQASFQLEDFILNMDNERNKLEVKLVRTTPKSEEYLRTEDEAFLLYKKYQITVHGDEPDEIEKEDFVRFLVTSPLEASYPESGPTAGYGSFHLQYWMNDMLIAVGVIDILPYCVSSVYFFYDPDFKVLSLGTYGSLREISFVRNLKLSVPSIQFYYMGYYIHTCPKMKYKGNFSPSYLLCPETYTWHSIEKCLPKLDASKYSRLEEDPSVRDENELVDLRKVVVDHRGIQMRYNTYRSLNPADEDLFRLYGKLIGAKCAVNMLYVII